MTAEPAPEWLSPREQAESQAATPDMLRALADHRDSSVRKAVAGTPTAPADVLDRLADDRAPHVREAVASNPAASPDTLRRIAVHPIANEILAICLCLNPATPADLLDRYAEIGTDYLLNAIAKNPAAPGRLLDRITDLYFSPEGGQPRLTMAARSLAANPATPTASLLRLAADDDDLVPLAVSARDDLTDDIRTILALRGYWTPARGGAA